MKLKDIYCLVFIVRQGNKSKFFYMFSSFGLLGVESRDFSQVEKERTACEAMQANSQNIHYFQSKRQPF